MDPFRKEAAEFDIHSIGVYRYSSPGKDNDLVVHVPIELSRLISGFLCSSEDNSVAVTVSGKRKRELGLVVPGCYAVRSKRRKYAVLLLKELQEIKKRYSHFNFELENNVICRPVVKPVEEKTEIQI